LCRTYEELLGERRLVGAPLVSWNFDCVCGLALRSAKGLAVDGRSDSQRELFAAGICVVGGDRLFRGHTHRAALSSSAMGEGVVLRRSIARVPICRVFCGGLHPFPSSEFIGGGKQSSELQCGKRGVVLVRRAVGREYPVWKISRPTVAAVLRAEHLRSAVLGRHAFLQ